VKSVGLLVAVAAACLTVRSVRAAVDAETPCPISHADAPAETYERLHQIPTRDRRRLPMVTPGGMILESPKMVAATDVLTITARDETTICYRLVTFARDRARCTAAGAAQRESDSASAYLDQRAGVRLVVLDSERISVEPLEQRTRASCEPNGGIEAAVYSRVDEPQVERRR
jgi:hypothetical protein